MRREEALSEKHSKAFHSIAEALRKTGSELVVIDHTTRTVEITGNGGARLSVIYNDGEPHVVLEQKGRPTGTTPLGDKKGIDQLTRQLVELVRKNSA